MAVIRRTREAEQPFSVAAAGKPSDLDDLDLAVVNSGNLFKNRRNHLAGSAPFGPKVYEHWAFGLKNVLLERAV